MLKIFIGAIREEAMKKRHMFMCWNNIRTRKNSDLCRYCSKEEKGNVLDFNFFIVISSLFLNLDIVEYLGTDEKVNDLF